jgi:chromosome segregation ATPase
VHSSDAGEDAHVEDCRGIGDRDERARATVEQLQARVEELEEELDTARVRISELEQQLLAKQGGAQGFAVRSASIRLRPHASAQDGRPGRLFGIF